MVKSSNGENCIAWLLKNTLLSTSVWDGRRKVGYAVEEDLGTVEQSRCSGLWRSKKDGFFMVNGDI